MDPTNRLAKAGAIWYALWGIVHVLGAALQLVALRSQGGAGLTAMISTARPFDAQAAAVPEASAAFMGMGAFNLLWIGALVTVVAVTLNWRNARLGYWLNLGIVGATDAGLLWALLVPGIMAWSDGLVGLVLFAAAVVCSTLGRAGVRGLLVAATTA
jgi:hypothetical protein